MHQIKTIFAAIFKEFGLYHVLGMGKGAIAQVMVWETLFVSLFSIAAGIVLGLALTKFSELVLLNILQQEINYRLSVSLTGILMTMGIFALIFLFLLGKDCWQVYRSDPLALLHSENTGEKPPRSHLLPALLGVVLLAFAYYLAVSTQSPVQVIAEIYRQRDEVFSLLSREDGYGYSSACRPLEKQGYYMLYGSLFFLGILLSIVFIFAAVLIIYYKQISEGYEDRSRYVIMRKVGMTREDIRKSVNSQILTVFFAPLLFAGLHLTFAFPLIWKILQLFGLFNFGLTVFVTVAAFLLFGLLYALVYKITAYAHYRIVSSDGEE